MVSLAVTAVGWVLAIAFVLAVGFLAVVGLQKAWHALPGRPADSAYPADAEAADRVWRRCNECGKRWAATPGREPSTLALRAARSRRHLARTLGAGHEVTVAGMHRCPACLSTDVRDSRRQHDVRRTSTT